MVKLTRARSPRMAEQMQAKQAAILDAALSLFADHGFEATPVPALAQRAGVATGSIYRYFPTKEAVVNALYCRCKEQFGAFVWAGFDQEGDHEARFRQVWRRMAAFALAEPAQFRFLEMHYHQEYLEPASIAVSDAVGRPAHAFMAEAVALGIVKPLPTAVLVALVFGALTGLVKATDRTDQDRLTLDQATIEATGACLWQALAQRSR